MNKERLLKYIEGECTENDKVAISNWIDSDPKNLKEFLALRKLYDITIWQESGFSTSKRDSVDHKRIHLWKPVYREVLKIAAVLVLSIIVSGVFFSQFRVGGKNTLQTLHVPAGQRSEITLADGTKVFLNANTTFTFPSSFTGGKREVNLDGEGFFEVSKNKSNPFIVKTNKYDIKVLGTKFNLMAYASSVNFETSLLEGSVEILKPNKSKGGVILKPDQRIYLEANSLVVAPITDRNHILWKDGILSFDNESFSSMVEKLELYFDLDIEIKNDHLRNYYCTGKFRTKDGIEHILDVLQVRNKFSYSMDEIQNKLTIE